MAKIFAEAGVAGLSRANHLSEDENRELFRCRDAPRLADLVVTGIERAVNG
jgi:hypothetical protein